MSNIAAFMLGEQPDQLGRYIHEILAFDAFWLEHDHKYIQVLFPIDEGTKFNRHAPLVTDADRTAFANDPALRAAHLQALDKMLAFWGLAREGETITPILPLAPATHVWLKPHDHNQLRLSRVIRSLALLGNPAIAVQLSACLLAAADQTGSVSEKTRYHWQHALMVSA
ncbi:opioid growth factor receptor-related protein [Photobacterium aphoticum]|uniref:Opioid growth factor receptor (OGFr) conserved domain-containing protein n=1 Tax=Photobacterium aphoticum TaxID=754436 RepID=A0A0J1GGY0_9GAMM|nr:opioid growth factor receptor-related protein [Photobacterium aphoticum]KLU98815.1 hypothetical protein ABT58_20560 [Photobacterium aphoticum]PSU56772.1 hypothetical protein C9I90_11920 [Photobacterium aphoticum]GHA65634.1 hypothetical protein GCM10007086_44020 [Photobacterium aphoticum]